MAVRQAADDARAVLTLSVPASGQPAPTTVRLRRHGSPWRPALRPSPAAKDARLHHRRTRHAGARHWRQHHHLLARADDAAQAAAVPESRPGRHGLGGQNRGGFPQKHARSRQLPGLARDEPVVHRHGGHRICVREHHRRRLSGDRPRPSRDGELLLRPGRPARGGPRLHGGGRHERSASRRDQPCTLAAPLRRRSERSSAARSR